MNPIELRILQVRDNYTSSRSCFVDLIELNGKRCLPILVGTCEGQVINYELEGNVPPRPFTHDLFKHFADTFGIKLERVLIREFKEGIFFSTLFCRRGEEEVKLDSRTSDAIALAQRFNCPILADEKVFHDAGVSTDRLREELPGYDFSVPDEKPSGYSAKTMGELEEMLMEAIENEDYELAARIRDEMDKRK